MKLIRFTYQHLCINRIALHGIHIFTCSTSFDIEVVPRDVDIGVDTVVVRGVFNDDTVLFIVWGDIEGEFNNIDKLGNS